MCASGSEELDYELRSESTKQGKAKEKDLGILFFAGISLSPRTGQDCLEEKLDTRVVSARFLPEHGRAFIASWDILNKSEWLRACVKENIGKTDWQIVGVTLRPVWERHAHSRPSTPHSFGFRASAFWQPLNYFSKTP